MELTKMILAFVKELDGFLYELSSIDRVWNILFPGEKDKWHHINIVKYRETYYITHINGDGGNSDGGSLEVVPKKGEQGVGVTDHLGTRSHPIENYGYLEPVWESLIVFARKWMKQVGRDWIKANKRVQVEYPLQYRYGTAPNGLIRDSLADIYRLDKALGKGRTRKFVRLADDGFFIRSRNSEVASMTVSDYFEYCRIAYIAGRRKEEEVDDSLSGREMYERYADGRHEGLLDIDPSSEQEFADWIDGTHPKRDRGGHPWEIKRGGNTTHIDLYVMRPSQYQKEGFKVELRGESIGRMNETIRMFLGLHAAGLPISIANAEGVRKRLLGQDRIGIIPSYNTLHRANQSFHRDEDVFDVMYYDDLGRYKRRITPFIAWWPLSILRPA